MQAIDGPKEQGSLGHYYWYIAFINIYALRHSNIDGYSQVMGLKKASAAQQKKTCAICRLTYY